MRTVEYETTAGRPFADVSIWRDSSRRRYYASGASRERCWRLIDLLFHCGLHLSSREFTPRGGERVAQYRANTHCRVRDLSGD